MQELHWHEYGKTARAGRKLGHVTLLADSATLRDRLAQRLLRHAGP
jgi:5-(carboxyamino)imidazole ribonucleotide synthase